MTSIIISIGLMRATNHLIHPQRAPWCGLAKVAGGARFCKEDACDSQKI